LTDLRAACGDDAVASALAEARRRVLATRADRRKARAVEAIVDPAAAAADKQRKHARKRRAEADKMAEIKKRRAAGVPLGGLVKTLKRKYGRQKGVGLDDI